MYLNCSGLNFFCTPSYSSVLYWFTSQQVMTDERTAERRVDYSGDCFGAASHSGNVGAEATSVEVKTLSLSCFNG